jgi:tRNA 2-thiouridine synthesizing protein E
MLNVGEKRIDTDQEGYLSRLDDWSPEVAEQLAMQEGIALSNEHWELITLIRKFYAVYELSPAMRPLIKYTQQQLGPEKGKSIYLLKLFPGSPAKLAAKIAGLPRPANCL